MAIEEKDLMNFIRDMSVFQRREMLGMLVQKLDPEDVGDILAMALEKEQADIVTLYMYKTLVGWRDNE
jgi:hypothetical protein